MNKTAVWAIAQKDMGVIRSNKQILLPMIIVPLVIGVILPTVLLLVAKSVDVSAKDLNSIMNMVQKLPAGELRDQLLSMPSVNHQVIYLAVNYFLAPLFLLIPVMSSTIIAANSFVGEKERRTLESLLFAPIDVKSLFIGKVLSALIPTLLLTLGSFVMFGLVADGVGYSMFGRLIFPNWNWVVLMLWVVPSISLCTILFNVLISARVKGFQEAQQIGGLIVLPVIAMVVAQVSGLMFVQPTLLLIIGAVLLVISLVLLQRIAKLNDRQVLFEKQVH
ncbi:MAG: ABC transporter permease subunit [Tumebacillaceae bacterium]